MVCMIMVMRLVVSRHAQHAKEAVQYGALIEVRKAGSARPAEEVAGNLEDVVLGACLFRLCPMHMLHSAPIPLSIAVLCYERRAGFPYPHAEILAARQLGIGQLPGSSNSV